MVGENDNLNAGDDLQRELDEALGDMSLASLIDLDVKPQAPSGEGNVRRGQVIGFQGKDIFVDMGGKSQGVLTLEAWGNKELPEIGDWIEVTIEGYDKSDGLLVLSRQGAVRAATWAKLEEGSIVEGRVTGHNKGGLELDVDGIKAFMPISHVELERVEELSPYVNRRLKCQITDIRRDEKQLVVSRRSVLKMEQEAARQQSFDTLAEGQTVRGKVRTIMPYGAFVEIANGVDGLLHVKDMSYSRVDDPKSVVTEGQSIEVMILKIDRESRRLSLGLKQVMPDPWTDVAIKYPVDTILIGRVTRLAEFGAFVELESAVEGLVPIGEMSFERRIKHPSEIANVGDTIKVRVMSVDANARRISLSIKRLGEDPWTGASVRWPVESVVTGTVKRLAEFGAFVELTPGVEGLVHISELSDARVRSASEVVREGQSVQVKVLEVDEERHRISLSIKAVAATPDYTGEVAAEPEAPKPKKERKKPLKGGLEW